MNKLDSKIRHLLLVMNLILAAGTFYTVTAQDQRYIHIGETQCFFKDYGCELELQPDDFLIWPAQYDNVNQHTTRMKGLWIGAKNFNDPVLNKKLNVKVIGIGPRLPANQFTMVFPQSIKLIGKYYHPKVIVDDQIGTSNELYDKLDDLDDKLPCDRMVAIKFNTSIGVSVTRKILYFTQQNHDNYFIQEYVLKNTGIYDKQGDVLEQTLQDFWVYFNYLYAFAGVTSSGFGATWGSFGSEWGTSDLLADFGPGTPNEHPVYPEIRGFYGWYGPTNSYSHPLTPSQDWGCPDYQDTGVLGSAKYTGVVTLFASKGPKGDYVTDDSSQPATTAYTGADGNPMDTAVSQFDVDFMQQRYNIMTEGHLDHRQIDAVLKTIGNTGYVEDWTGTLPYRNTGTRGASAQGQGFGPYTLEPGDSIRIVFAEGVTGISWEKCRQVGANWIAYYKDLPSKPDLVMPDGSPASADNEWNFNPSDAYKRAWVETGVDSVLQMLRSALANFKSGYIIPQPPPAPSSFTVQSGGDRIRLSWANNATSDPHFDGYVIYRSRGNVNDYRTIYEKIFECNAANAVHQYDDISALRGFNYYYYIQSKDDGTQNEVQPGKPLYSSLSLTLTSVPATLQRLAGTALEQIRVVPNPYDIRARALQFGSESQYDRIVFYGLPPVCEIKIFTERGDLIWQKEHTNGSGDEIWDSQTSSGQIIVSGIYIVYFQVTEDTYATSDISDESTGAIIFRKGELMFHKGESIYRKFVVIR
jgi:hypothetical protein